MNKIKTRKLEARRQANRIRRSIDAQQHKIRMLTDEIKRAEDDVQQLRERLQSIDYEMDFNQ